MSQHCWLLLALGVALAAAQNNGATECPCISAYPSGDLQAKVTAGGYPSSYGLGGCKKHDSGLATNGCNVANPPTWCESEWCYIDMAKCQVDSAQCTAAGGKVGGTGSGYCRSRSTRPSSFNSTSGSLFYSYETCGNLNSYTPSRVGDSLKGAHLYVTAEPNYPPGVIHGGDVDPERSQWGGLTGHVIEIVNSMLFSVDPAATIELDQTQWATAESRAKFASSYTACVHDVALGVYDICIGQFWLTPQRLNLAQFLPPFDTSKFYLIVPGNEQQEGFAETLGKPFAPFSPELWGFVIGFLIFAALVMTVTDVKNRDDYENGGAVPRVFKSLYFAFNGYVSGGNANAPASVPGRLAALGFGFFVLITLASYTANLATILVAKNSVQGINSVEDAIDQGITLCIPSPLESNLKTAFPTMKYVTVGDSFHVAGMLRLGECGGIIDTTVRYEGMVSGHLSEHDCKLADADAEKGDAHYGCVRGSDGKADPLRDCNLLQVGDLITTVPISMPVSDRLVHALGWTMVLQLNSGKVESAFTEFKDKAAPNLCGAASSEEANELSLPLESMVGTLVVSCAFQFIALVLAFIEWVTKRPVQKLLGMYEGEEEEEVATKQAGADVEAKLSTIDAPAGGDAAVSSRHFDATLAEVKALLRSEMQDLRKDLNAGSNGNGSSSSGHDGHLKNSNDAADLVPPPPRKVCW